MRCTVCTCRPPPGIAGEVADLSSNTLWAFQQLQNSYGDFNSETSAVCVSSRSGFGSVLQCRHFRVPEFDRKRCQTRPHGVCHVVLPPLRGFARHLSATWLGFMAIRKESFNRQSKLQWVQLSLARGSALLWQASDLGAVSQLTVFSAGSLVQRFGFLFHRRLVDRSSHTLVLDTVDVKLEARVRRSWLHHCSQELQISLFGDSGTQGNSELWIQRADMTTECVVIAKACTPAELCVQRADCGIPPSHGGPLCCETLFIDGKMDIPVPQQRQLCLYWSSDEIKSELCAQRATGPVIRTSQL